MKVYFTDWFHIDPSLLADYGAFNVSLINDLPLFIDPFLLFTSEKDEYRKLHDGIITYLRFLRDRATDGGVNDGLLQAWYMFPEVKELWLGFSLKGNNGSGLGIDFARSLHKNLNVIFKNFGDEQVTKGSHLEKVCLIHDGVGRDNISDFTANLIKQYLLDYTQEFCRAHVAPELRGVFAVRSVYFDYERRVWCPKRYELPALDGKLVLLTPRDILTKDENWINRHDLFDRFEEIAESVPDNQIRSQVNQYLARKLTEKSTVREQNEVYGALLQRFPELIERYIRWKEDHGDEAVKRSRAKVTATEEQFVLQVGEFIRRLETESEFYRHGIDTYEECRTRLMFLKGVIENNDGYRLFYHKGKPVQRENDLQILFRLTWLASPSDFNSEVNNGRGPVDFTASRGGKDKSLVEFKLASNSKLKQNLAKQVAVYETANRTNKSLKAIFYFSAGELAKVDDVLSELKLDKDESIILIDCRADNKPSASKAK
jgi:hypothetical protein